MLLRLINCHFIITIIIIIIIKYIRSKTRQTCRIQSTLCIDDTALNKVDNAKSVTGSDSDPIDKFRR